MRRDLYASEPATDAAMAAGLSALGQEAQRSGASFAWLVCDTKMPLDGGMLATALGTNAAKALAKGQRVSIDDNVNVSFYSAATLPTAAQGAVILLCYPSRKLLDKVDALRDAAALIVLPWILEEVQPWIAARGPEDILRRGAPVAQTISNPVVERALRSILMRINQSTGISHPRDKDAVVDAFRILRRGGEHVHAQEIRSWLLQQGIAPRHANDITAIAENPSGFRMSSKVGSWRADILEQWRERK